MLTPKEYTELLIILLNRNVNQPATEPIKQEFKNELDTEKAASNDFQRA